MYASTFCYYLFWVLFKYVHGVKDIHGDNHKVSLNSRNIFSKGTPTQDRSNISHIVGDSYRKSMNVNEISV